jgi:hypothetical protein
MRQRDRFTALLLALALPAAVFAAPGGRTVGLQDPQWSVYSDQFGTRVDYPAGIFATEEGTVPRGEGRSLRSADGHAHLLVYVERNAEHHTPASFMRTLFAAQASETGYKRVAKTFFAVSGARQGHIYYSRCNFPSGSAGPLHCIYLDYPRDEKKLWDAIVTRISLSLRPSRRR